MSKHVPDTQPDRDLQYEQLIHTLTGSVNKAFLAVRGKLGERPFDAAALGEDDAFCNSAFSRMLYEERTPTNALQAFDSFKAAERVMLNLAAKLRRDYHHYALIELLRALHDPEYVLPCEDVPLEKTVPVVLYMLDPTKVFAMVRWLKEAKRSHVHRFEKKTSQGIPKINKQLIACLTGGPPAYFERSDASRNIFEGSTSTIHELLWMFARELFPTFCVDEQNDTPLWWQGPQGVCQHMFPEFDIDNRDIYTPNLQKLWVTHHTGQTRYMGALAYLKKGTQDGVLKNVARSSQSLVATWQFHLPLIFTRSRKTTSIDFEFARLQIAFFPEHEHAMWKKRFPAFVSRGVNQGLGAIVVHPGLDVNPFVEKAHRNAGIHDHFVLCTPEVTKRFVKERNADMKHRRHLQAQTERQRGH
jgi:hypothetical protein